MTLAILEQPVSNLSGRFARLLSRTPWMFIIFPICLTVLLSSGIVFKLKIVRGVHWLYSPLDSEWETEEEVFREGWASNDNRFYPGRDVLLRKGLYLIASSKNSKDVDENVLDPSFCKQLIQLLDAVSNSSFVASTGRTIRFDDICLRFQNQCFSNSHIRMLAQVFMRGQAVSKTQLNVTYPLFTSKFLTEPIDISSIIGGVEVNSSTSVVSKAKAWMLTYQLKQQTPELNQISSDFQYKLPELIQQLNLSRLNVDHFHSEAFDDELAKNTREMAPRFAITFGILIVFSVLCTFTTTNSNHIDWVVSKPLLGIAGVLNALMAIVSSIGFLLILDVVFVDICIGTDDAFLLLTAWRETSPSESVEKRTEDTLRHSGVAILITSLADSLAFLIGSTSTMPAVRYFSLYSSVSICFLYLYTMTFFSAIMVLQGRGERRQKNSLLGCLTIAAEQKDIPPTSRIFNLGNRTCVATKKHQLWYQEFFAESFSSAISRPSFQILAFLSYLVYLVIAVNGLFGLQVGFDIMNIVCRGSPTDRFIQMRSLYFPNDVSRLDVAVLRPPNMGNQTEKFAFLKVLEQLESTKCSTGRKQTKFWFFGYLSYLNEMGFDDTTEDLNYTEFREQLQPFLLNSAKFSYDIIENEDGSLKQFRLSLGLKTLATDDQILECAKEMRRNCENNRNTFNIQTYSPLWNLADQFETVWPQTLQDIFISMVIMLLVAFLFIPQGCCFAIGMSILSVSFGVLGFLHFLNVKLNATSMITLAMSVGFSVDFASHVTYSFMSIKDEDPKAKLSGALRSVGWPITQTSTAVLLGIITLGTVQNQLVQTVFKAVVLVILFGLVHALIYIPLLLLKIHQFQGYLK